MSYDELRKRARMELQKMMMIEKEVRAKVNMPDDVKAYYDAHQEDFTSPRKRFKLAQILIALPPNATPAQVERRANKADEDPQAAPRAPTSASSRACTPTTTRRARAANSDGFAPGDINDPILAAVKPLKPGEISEPVRTSHGFHIVKLEEHEVPGVVPLSEVKAQIRAELVDQQSSAAREVGRIRSCQTALRRDHVLDDDAEHRGESAAAVGDQHGRSGGRRPRGDPQGGGGAREPSRRASMVVVGDLSAMRAAAARIGDVPAPREWRPGEPPIRLARASACCRYRIVSARALRPARPTVEGGGAAYDYIVKGARMAMSGEVDALVTAPISKDWMNRAGHHFPGHSELLA